MISATPISADETPNLPRPDLIAIFQYLNRKEFEGRSARQQLALADGVLRRLAAASRMQ